MRAGALRELLIVQKPTEVQDLQGEPETTWSEFDQLWAGEMTDAGRETETRDTALAASPSNWTLRHRHGVTEKMRMLVHIESTTLDGSITAAVTTITVTSSADFPLEGEFRIQIESELLLVTAGWGTTSWTVTRGLDGTTAATHADDVILHRMGVVDIQSVRDPDGRRRELAILGVTHG